MAKKSTSDEDPKGPGAAVVEAEDPGIELPVLDQQDEDLLTRAGEREERVEPSEEEAEAETTKPKGEAKAKPKVEPAKEAPTPEPVKAEAEVPEKHKLTPIERAERDKRKAALAKWQASEEEADRLRARISQLQQERRVGEVKVAPERLAALKARLKATLKDAAELDVVAERAVEESLGEATYLVQERDKQWQEQVSQLQAQHKFSNSWLGARITHKDFDQVVIQSGLYADIVERADGTCANPYLFKRIYLAADPGEEAYQLALGKMEAAAARNGEPGDDTESGTSAPRAESEPDKPVKHAAKAEPEGDEAAERRGARKVIEQVETIAKKPRGIAGLKPATGPKTQWTKGDLDKLMRDNPARYQELVSRFPQLERYHLSD